MKLPVPVLAHSVMQHTCVCASVLCEHMELYRNSSAVFNDRESDVHQTPTPVATEATGIRHQPASQSVRLPHQREQCV